MSDSHRQLDSTPSAPGDPTPSRLPAAPFVVGRPLRADEPIFGRDAAFRFLAGELARFSSVNIVGERRMGKTSLLNHLLTHQDTYLIAQPDQPPLLLARLDLQDDVSRAARFYGTALRELLARLPHSRSGEARALVDLHERLDTKPESSYDEFRRVLRRLRDQGGVRVRPVVVVDEFELLVDPAAGERFPYPDFFNSLRALITAELLAMIVASRRPLAEYFGDPARPGSLTSTFPTYFIPLALPALDDAAADALLLQPSDRPLALAEVSEARRWASGHPCHLQVAGAAWYQAKLENHPPEWVRRRREELKSQNCMVGAAASARPAASPGRPRRVLRTILRALRAVFISAPLSIGRVVQRLGARIDDMAAWIIGAVLIVLVLLLALGVATGADVLNMVKRSLGLETILFK